MSDAPPVSKGCEGAGFQGVDNNSEPRADNINIAAKNSPGASTVMADESGSGGGGIDASSTQHGTTASSSISGSTTYKPPTEHRSLYVTIAVFEQIMNKVLPVGQQQEQRRQQIEDRQIEALRNFTISVVWHLHHGIGQALYSLEFPTTEHNQLVGAPLVRTYTFKEYCSLWRAELVINYLLSRLNGVEQHKESPVPPYSSTSISHARSTIAAVEDTFKTACTTALSSGEPGPDAARALDDALRDITHRFGTGVLNELSEVTLGIMTVFPIAHTIIHDMSRRSPKEADNMNIGDPAPTEFAAPAPPAVPESQGDGRKSSWEEMLLKLEDLVARVKHRNRVSSWRYEVARLREFHKGRMDERMRRKTAAAQTSTPTTDGCILATEGLRHTLSFYLSSTAKKELQVVCLETCRNVRRVSPVGMHASTRTCHAHAEMVFLVRAHTKPCGESCSVKQAPVIAGEGLGDNNHGDNDDHNANDNNNNNDDNDNIDNNNNSNNSNSSGALSCMTCGWKGWRAACGEVNTPPWVWRRHGAAGLKRVRRNRRRFWPDGTRDAKGDAVGPEANTSLSSSLVLPRCRYMDSFRTIQPKPTLWSRVPPLLVTHMTWYLGLRAMEKGRALPPQLESLTLGSEFNHPFVGFVWPSTLRELTLGQVYNTPLDKMDWPPGLETLTFGHYFNRSLDAVCWPANLQQITFGSRFNQPIAGVSWPRGLKRLRFGRRFNQPIVDSQFPHELEEIGFGCHFNQPLSGHESFKLPAGLRRLCMGYKFNHDIRDVSWPDGLTYIELGVDFNQPLVRIMWPSKLEHLLFGSMFDHPIHTVAWPAGLKRLRFGQGFAQAMDQVAWPPALEELTLGSLCYNEDGAEVLGPPWLKRLHIAEPFVLPDAVGED